MNVNSSDTLKIPSLNKASPIVCSNLSSVAGSVEYADPAILNARSYVKPAPELITRLKQLSGDAGPLPDYQTRLLLSLAANELERLLKCPACHGVGRINQYEPNQFCDFCGGKGWMTG